MVLMVLLEVLVITQEVVLVLDSIWFLVRYVVLMGSFGDSNGH